MKSNSIAIYQNEGSKPLLFKDFHRKIIYLFIGWFILVSFAVVVNITRKEIALKSEINELRFARDNIEQEFSLLKEKFNAAAADYLEAERINRIVLSVNPWLKVEDVDLWTSTLMKNSDILYSKLNETSEKKIGNPVNQYSVTTGTSLFLAVAAFESDFRMSSNSKKGAYGPMQLKEVTARHIGLNDHMDPEENIYGGAVYLAQQLERYYDYPDQLELALASYNAGTTRVKREWMSEWGNDWQSIHTGLSSLRSFKETRNYVTAIISLSRMFSSGQWSEMDREFWSSYKRYIFRTEYANLNYNAQSNSLGSDGS